MTINLTAYDLTRTQMKAVKAYIEAWAPYEEKRMGVWGHTIHHDQALEPLLYPPSHRLRCFIKVKDRNELITRCNNCRPVKGKLPEKLVSAAKEYKRELEKSVLECTEFRRVFEKLGCAAKVFSSSAKYLAMRKRDVPLSTWNGKSIFEEDKL